ncbi:sphingomyelin phosphodiesterase-like [Anthonomus grandis grandis]|uniref:sphingomyelin phosphodiesterase-like n=1 Tax=Anthonomus grandis grandis TaxID=2921223 RepID=UPI00216552A9|nr:sphingomyelin phosphodiesterase-like [Anthonomus grandis grandis]
MRVETLLSLLVVCFCVGAGGEDDGGDEDLHRSTFDEQLKTLEKQFANHLGIHRYRPMEVPKFKDLLDLTGITQELQTRTFTNNIQDRIICGACQALIRNLQRNAITIEVVGTAICKLYISLNTWTLNDFCQQVVRVNKPILEYIVKNSRILTPEYACSVLLQNENCYIHHPSLSWRLEMPEGGPTLPTKPPSPPGDLTRPLKVLHLSDFHVSHDYEVGGISNCGYPVCCKRGLGNPIKGRDAGPWGDYNCDIPPWFYANTLNYINNTHRDIDLIYFTGDIVDHSIWRASEEENAREIAHVFRQLAESFPNVAVLPAIGNHESVPLNIFAPPYVTEPGLTQRWLYELDGDLWSRWIPKEAVANVRRQGYFSVLANHKLRVIVLNNNVCYIYNWWLLYDTHFLKEQLEFLKTELTEAESHGQFVHIVAHVFPGDKECIEPWEVNYNSLITRFSHIIKGQFFGHTHTDGLKVFYSKIDGSPINVGFNGASLTPYTKYNPNYKIISVDPVTFDVLDVETYSFNLTEANLYSHRTPLWKRLYSLKEAYDLSDLFPENFDMLAKRLREDRHLFDQYWRFYVREGDASLRDGCNQDCREELLESITRTESLST